MKVLFVCTGNICRSPMAKIMLKQKLKNLGVSYIKVFSAGTDCPNGWAMTKESGEALKKLGYKKEPHKSTDINTLNLNEFKIFALTEGHKRKINAPCQSARDIIGEDVGDPWGFSQSVYDNCAKQIEKFCNAIIEEIVTVEVKK